MVVSESETSSEGSPIIPPRRPQAWVTGEPDIGVIPPMPEHVHRPQQPFVHGPWPPESDSDEGPTVTFVNAKALQPTTTPMPTVPTMMPPQSVVGPPGPPIYIAPPSTSSTPSVRRDYALTQPQLPSIIIQPPAWPPQQFQQPPPVVTVVEPDRRRRRRRRYSVSSASSSFSRTTRSRSRSRERRRRRYSPSRPSRARSYTPTRRRRSRSRSYSPSRRYSSRYYSPSRRSTSSRSPTRHTTFGNVTILPVPTSTHEDQAPPERARSFWRVIQQRLRKKTAKEPRPPVSS